MQTNKGILQYKEILLDKGEHVTVWQPLYMGACGEEGRTLDLRLEDLGFDSHCWSCVEVLGKLLIPYCLCLPSSTEYHVERKLGKLLIAIAAENAMISPQRR